MPREAQGHPPPKGDEGLQASPGSLARQVDPHANFEGHEVDRGFTEELLVFIASDIDDVPHAFEEGAIGLEGEGTAEGDRVAPTEDVCRLGSKSELSRIEARDSYEQASLLRVLDKPVGRWNILGGHGAGLEQDRSRQQHEDRSRVWHKSWFDVSFSDI